jgi:hypothetical protein
MGWFEKHLNWSYGLALIIGTIALLVIGFIFNNAIGYIIFIVIIYAGACLVYWRKQTSIFPLLFAIPFLLAIMALVAHNNRPVAVKGV